MKKQTPRKPTGKTPKTAQRNGAQRNGTAAAKTRAARMARNFGVVAYTKGSRFTAEEARAAVEAVLREKRERAES